MKYKNSENGLSAPAAVGRNIARNDNGMTFEWWHKTITQTLSLAALTYFNRIFLNSKFDWKTNNNLLILHFNIKNLQKHVDELTNYLALSGLEPGLPVEHFKK